MLVQLAVRWGSDRFQRMAKQLAADLLARAGNDALEAKARTDAASELIALRRDDPRATESVLELITPRMPPELAGELLAAIKASHVDAAGATIAERLPAMTPAVRAAGVGVLLSRPAWTRRAGRGPGRGQAALGRPVARSAAGSAEHPDKKLRQRAQALLERGGVLPNPDRRKVLDELLPLASQPGDAARGKEVFKKQCAKCHVHGSEGTRIGPDLTGVAVHPKAELLENILDPSRSVEGNFRVYTLATADGQVITGLLAAESKSTVELFDAEGKKHSVLREDIDELVASPKSLMPEGFEKQIKPDELVDLLEFLAERGKYLPLPLDKVATTTSTRGMFYRADAAAERLVFDDWSPKTFAGVPFHLVDPEGDRVANAVMLYGPQGLAAKMPHSVSLPCHAAVRGIHLLGGVSGWGYPARREGLGQSDRAAALRRWHDRRPPAAQRRSPGRLRPPRRRARLAIRLRPRRPPTALSGRPSPAPRPDRTHRAGQRTRQHGPGGDGGDG